MPKSRVNRLMQLIPAYIASVIDISFTIICQDPTYWKGNLSKANEGNPVGRTLMENHVSGLFLICGIWLTIIGIAG